MKALIAGASGQDGHFLSAFLRRLNIEVLAFSRSGGQLRGDVSDLAFVQSLIQHHKPDFVFHLAANSSTRHSALFENHYAISTGTLNLLESVRRFSPSARVFLSGSAMQFRNEGLPIDEQAPFEASSPYSIARIQSVYAARYFRSAFSLRVYVGYFFNHDSQLRSERHVNQKIVTAVLKIANGSSEKLILGSVGIRKEFNYAADMVEAVWTLVNQEDVFEVVIGSGTAHSIQEWTEYCFGKIGKRWRDFVEIDSNFVPEYQVLVSNPGLIKSLGWRPRVDMYGLADIMMGGE